MLCIIIIITGVLLLQGEQYDCKYYQSSVFWRTT